MSIAITIAALLFVVAASAQSRENFLVSGPVGLVFPVSDAPFSTQQVEERTWIDPDGTSTTENVVSQIYRDSAGRMRIEWRLPSGLGWASIVNLIDPVSRSMAMLLVDSKIASYLVKPHSDSGPFNVGLLDVGRALPAGKWQMKKEALGTRIINGLEAEGERIVQTSEDQPPLVAVRETWRSPALRIRWSVEASGPSWRHTARLQNVDRHEPDPLLFVIPPDYAIQDR